MNEQNTNRTTEDEMSTISPTNQQAIDDAVFSLWAFENDSDTEGVFTSSQTPRDTDSDSNEEDFNINQTNIVTDEESNDANFIPFYTQENIRSPFPSIQHSSTPDISYNNYEIITTPPSSIQSEFPRTPKRAVKKRQTASVGIFTFASTFLARARLADRNSKYKEAIQNYMAALELDSSLNCLSELATALEEDKQYTKSVEYYRRSIEELDDMLAMYNLADLYTRIYRKEIRVPISFDEQCIDHIIPEPQEKVEPTYTVPVNDNDSPLSFTNQRRHHDSHSRELFRERMTTQEEKEVTDDEEEVTWSIVRTPSNSLFENVNHYPLQHNSEKNKRDTQNRLDLYKSNAIKYFKMASNKDDNEAKERLLMCLHKFDKKAFAETLSTVLKTRHDFVESLYKYEGSSPRPNTFAHWTQNNNMLEIIDYLKDPKQDITSDSAVIYKSLFNADNNSKLIEECIDIIRLNSGVVRRYENKLKLFTKLNARMECGICYDCDKIHIDFNCGHTTCYECYKRCINNCCPFCREDLEEQWFD